jgi:DNA polymerase-1
LSSDGPNLQQVPKRDKELAPLFRRVFVSDPGTFWSANDYKQQEFVVFAEYTGNERLVNGYKQNPPIDMHQSVADMLGVERDPTAKRMNLGMVYGMGVPKLAASLGISLSQAKEYRRRYDEEIPEARRFLKKAEMRARGRGYVMTFLGRRRRFPNPSFAHKAGNSVIQGGSADITKLKMVEIDEFFAANGDVAYLTLQVHDELDWFFPEGYEHLDVEARRIMEDFGVNSSIHMDTPLRVDSDVATDWGKASFPEFNWEDMFNG